MEKRNICTIRRNKMNAYELYGKLLIKKIEIENSLKGIDFYLMLISYIWVTLYSNRVISKSEFEDILR